MEAIRLIFAGMILGFVLGLRWAKAGKNKAVKVSHITKGEFDNEPTAEEHF